MGTQGSSKRRAFGRVGTRCLTADRHILVYAIVCLEEPETLDIKVIAVFCLKNIFKVTFGVFVFVSYHLFSTACSVCLPAIFGFTVRGTEEHCVLQ